MRKIIGVILLVIGLVTLFGHGQPPAGAGDYRAGYIVGQYTMNALFIGAGLYLLLQKKK